MYDFLLVINTNLPPILHRFLDIAFNMSKIAIFRYPLAFNPTDGAVPTSYHRKRYIIAKKLHALGYIPVAESLGICLSSTTFTQCAAKATEFGK